MKINVLITGVAGTGKTTLCEEFNKRNFAAFDVETTCKCTKWVCDLDVVKNFCDNNELTILVGSVANINDVIKFTDIVFYLHVEEEVLRERLRQRDDYTYSKINFVVDLNSRYKASLCRVDECVDNTRDIELTIQKILKKVKEYEKIN